MDTGVNRAGNLSCRSGRLPSGRSGSPRVRESPIGSIGQTWIAIRWNFWSSTRSARCIAARAACSLGKSGALALEPSIDPAEIHDRQSLTTEMVEAIRAGLQAVLRRPARHPPAGAASPGRRGTRGRGAGRDRRDLTGHRRARSLAQPDRRSVPATGRACGGASASSRGWSRRSTAASTVEPRSSTPPADGSPLSAARSAQVEERIQETLRHMLRSAEVRRSLRFPNFTMVGHHYVLPVSKDHRGEIEGAVLRTSASNETVYIEPRAIGERSAQLSFLRAARPRRSAASCDGSAPRSARCPRACWERSRRWPSST